MIKCFSFSTNGSTIIQTTIDVESTRVIFNLGVDENETHGKSRRDFLPLFGKKFFSLWMSVSFSDLPKDVIWMIFQFGLKDYFLLRNVSLYELGSKYPSHFYHYTGSLDSIICNLSLINRTTLRLVKSKTVKYGKNDWFFIKGSLLK